MAKVLDPTTGQPVDLPDNEAQAAFLEGKAGLVGDKIPVRDAMGNVGTVPADQAQAALLSGKYRLASDDALAEAEEKAKFGTTEQKLQTFGENAFNEALLGFGNAAMEGVHGPEWAQNAAARNRTNKFEATAGAVTGMVGPMFLSGGESLAARGVSAPMRMLTAAGRGAENITARALAGTGGGTLAGIARATVPRMAGGAIEGAILGAGQYSTQTTLGNPDARAEELIAMGALTGAVFGGAIGLGGYGLRAGSNALRRGIGGAADGTVNLAEALANRGKETALRLEQDAQRVLQENKGAIGEWATDRAFKATGGLGKKGDALNALEGEVRDKASQIAFHEAPAALKRKPGSILSKEEQAEAFATVRSQYGKKIGDTVKRVDELRYKPNLSQIVDDIRENVLTKLDTAFTRTEAEKIAQELRDVETHYGAIWKFDKKAGEWVRKRRAMTQTFEDLHKSRRALDDKIGWTKREGLKPLEQAYRDIRSGLEDGWIRDAEAIIDAHGKKLTKAGDAKGAKAIAGLVTDFRSAKVGYRAAATLQDAADDGVKRLLKNRTAGLSEHLSGMAGGFAGSLVGGPIGSVIGAGVGGVGAWGAKHYGDQALAAMAYKLSKGASVREVAAEMNRQVRDGVAGYLEKSNLGRQALDAGRRVLDSGRESGRKLLAEANDMRRIAGDTASRAATGTRRLAQRGAVLSLPEYTQTRAEIREQKDRPELLAASVQATGLQHAEPDVAKAMVSNARRINDFLDSKLPQQSLRPSLAGPKMLPPTGQDLAKFSRYLRAAKDPLSVLDDLRDDDLSPEAVEALRTCYPQLYGDITATVIDAVADAGESMPYERRITLGLLLGVPTDPTLTPEYQQAMAAADAAPMPTRGNPAPQPNPKPAPSRQTASERIASR